MPGRCIWIALAAVCISTASADNINYKYDAAGRLVNVAYPNGAAITYTYDKAGNLLSRVVSRAIGPNQAPTLTAAGVTNGASFVSGVSPGALATIFGVNLSDVQGVQTASSLPLPTEISTTTVNVGGTPAPLIAVINENGQEQINFQVPFEIAGQKTVAVVVTRRGVSSQPVQVTVMPFQPGIFTYGANNAVVVHGLTNKVITPSSPAAIRETVVLYLTGLGPVTNPPATGAASSSSPLSKATTTPLVSIGGVNAAPPAFSGLTPGFAGLGQINVVVPVGTPAGNVDLIVTVNGVASKAAKISVQ